MIETLQTAGRTRHTSLRIPADFYANADRSARKGGVPIAEHLRDLITLAQAVVDDDWTTAEFHAKKIKGRKEIKLSPATSTKSPHSIFAHKTKSKKKGLTTAHKVK